MHAQFAQLLLLPQAVQPALFVPGVWAAIIIGVADSAARCDSESEVHQCGK